MTKTILITGSTDGIGFETAKALVQAGHKVLLHGRSAQKLESVQAQLRELAASANTQSYVADLTRMDDVLALAERVRNDHSQLDVLINNAGVYSAPTQTTADAHDIRFVVNTIAPYLLTKLLLPIIGASGRVVNLSSAAQSPVDLAAMRDGRSLGEGPAYAQSKLAITMWSRHMAMQVGTQGPMIVAVNPASMLGSKMVKDAFGVAGGDLSIGSDILVRAALSEEFANASGKYFDNDKGAFGAPHPDALEAQKCAQLIIVMESMLDKIIGSKNAQ